MEKTKGTGERGGLLVKVRNTQEVPVAFFSCALPKLTVDSKKYFLVRGRVVFVLKRVVYFCPENTSSSTEDVLW